MKDKENVVVVIFETIVIVVLILYITVGFNQTRINTVSDNNVTEVDTKTNYALDDLEKREYIKTYNIIEKLDLSDETGNYDYYVIKEFQVDDPVVIKVDNKYELEEGKNYEIVLYGIKIDGKTYSQSEIIDNFEIKDIKQTDKTGLEQTQDIWKILIVKT